MNNTNKKSKIIIMFISLFAICIISGLIAHFTDNLNITKHLQTGIVNIKLEEYTIDENGNKIKWKDAKTFFSGDTISKIPEISCVNGSADCYIRAKIDIKIKDEELIKHEDMITLDNFDIDTNKWYYCKDDGYFYYKEILTDKSEPVELFTKICIPQKYGNSWALKEFETSVIAEAVQSKNFTPDFSENSLNPWSGIT